MGIAITSFANTIAANESSLVENLEISTSVTSNALTIAIKTAAGTDPSASDKVRIGFRNTTNSSGAYSIVELTSALSVVVSSGSTLGHSSATDHFIWLYAINNAGTIELGVSTTKFDTGVVLSSSAEGGAGAADSGSTIYSTTARANVAMRVLARLKSNQTTAGTWAAVPTEASLLTPEIAASDPVVARYKTGAGQSIANATVALVDFGTKQYDSHGSVTTGASWKFTAPIAGKYSVKAHIRYDLASFTATTALTLILFKNGTTYSYLTIKNIETTQNNRHSVSGTDSIDLVAGDYIDIRSEHGEAAARTLEAADNRNYIVIEKE